MFVSGVDKSIFGVILPNTHFLHSPAPSSRGKQRNPERCLCLPVPGSKRREEKERIFTVSISPATTTIPNMKSSKGSGAGRLRRISGSPTGPLRNRYSHRFSRTSIPSTDRNSRSGMSGTRSASTTFNARHRSRFRSCLCSMNGWKRPIRGRSSWR